MTTEADTEMMSLPRTAGSHLKLGEKGMERVLPQGHQKESNLLAL